MQLPDEFPHTRHEQYLVALPPELLSVAELRTALGVVSRLRSFHRRELVRLLLALDEADVA